MRGPSQSRKKATAAIAAVWQPWCVAVCTLLQVYTKLCLSISTIPIEVQQPRCTHRFKTQMAPEILHKCANVHGGNRHV